MGDPVKIGPYTIDREKRLGGGAFGTVFLGTDDNARSIAGKEIYLGILDDEPELDWIERVHAEVEAHKKIPPHRNLIRYVDSITKGNHMWIFTETCQQGDLNKYAKGHDISERQKLIMMKELAEALKHLHSQNPSVVHRDVKPENILMGDDGKVKLCDLGLAKITERHQGRTVTLKSRLGTEDYMAPELFVYDEDGTSRYSKKVDVFSAGIFFVTFIDSEPRQYLKRFTLKGESIGKVMDQSRRSGGLTAPPIKFNLRDSPQVTRLKALASNMIQFDPDQRPTMEEVLVELESILASMREERSSAHASGGVESLAEDFSGMATAEVRPTVVKRPAANTQKTLKKVGTPAALAPAPDSPHNVGSLTIVGGYKTLPPQYARSYACWREGRAGSWEDVTALPQKLIAVSVSAIKNGLFMAGGLDENKSVTKQCYVYLSESNDWRRRQDMPTARGGAAAVTAGECVYVLGGERGGKPANVCERYDVERDEWTSVSVMLQGMTWPIAALIQSNIFIIYNDDPFNKCTKKGDEITLQVLNTVTGKWRFGPPLPAHFGSTWGARAVSHNDTMLVAGGVSRMMAQYIPSTSTWLSLSPPHLDHAYGAMVVCGGRVVLMGGQCKDRSGKWSSVSDSIEEYDVERDVWVVSKQKMPCALWNHHLVVISY